MDWRVKGAIQKALGYVPGGDRLHYMLQRYAGGMRDFGRECDIKVDDWRLMMGHLRAAQIPVEGATLVEIGTGWYPTFPFCLYLAGVAKVFTFDLHRLIKSDMVYLLADRLAAHVALVAREARRSEDEVKAEQVALVTAMTNGASLTFATGGVIDYRAPADASETSLLSETVDVVFSNSVLEHVPRPVIEACFTEAMRILRPGGVMFHSVNCGDHYAYSDRTIDQLHYLQYSEADWAKWNNEFLYQNRLRAIEFIDMARHAGFTIEIDTSRASPQRLAQLDQITVDPVFAHYTRDQLAITSVDFIARKP
ncbi:MAG TPA: methyltransferase domain-containing protein [Kofleriaceae bacterium]|nr:methyltransferase domain-containing protein [Kofleriaceae bacterium]